MSNDNENSAVFSSRQNSCNDDAARIEDGKPFQARADATGKARSPSVTRLVDGTISADVAADRRPKAPTCIYVGGLAEGLGKIRWCSNIKAAVHQKTQPELDPLQNLQPVQFTEKWGCVFRPPRREHQACGGIHDRLYTAVTVCRKFQLTLSSSSQPC